MKKIIDNIFFTDKRNLELDYQYVYNSYKEDEFTQQDTEISNSTLTSENSFIQLKIEGNIDYPFALTDDLVQDGTSEFNQNIDVQKINELNSYTSLPAYIDKLFHVPSDINSQKSYFVFDIDFDNINEYYNYFLDREEIRNLNLSKNITLSKDFIKDYEISNKKSQFYSQRDNSLLENHISISTKISEDNEEQNPSNLDFELTGGKFLGEYSYYNRKVNDNIVPYLRTRSRQHFNERFIGFYIVKFRKNSADKDSLYERISSRFVSSTFSPNSNIQTIKDKFVKYSFTYRYMIYPVYSLTIRSSNVYFYDQILLCGYPMSTEDIEAKEHVLPAYPVGPKISIIKNTFSILLEWEKQYERQNDIKGFKVFKRNSIDEPFKLIKEYRGHLASDNFISTQNVQESVIESTPGVLKYQYVDEEADLSKINIYAICAIDAHGLVSNYSTQVSVVYDVLLEKLDLNKVSQGGAPLEYPNLLIPRKTKYFDNEDSIINNTPVSNKKSVFKIYFTPDTKKIVGDQINFNNYEQIVLNNDVEFNLSIFKLNGQENILINNQLPKITINNFS